MNEDMELMEGLYLWEEDYLLENQGLRNFEENLDFEIREIDLRNFKI
ncbi:MAG: hypothetical protein ACO20H_09470 [Bacteriovoracaceae bacterium]